MEQHRRLGCPRGPPSQELPALLRAQDQRQILDSAGPARPRPPASRASKWPAMHETVARSKRSRLNAHISPRPSSVSRALSVRSNFAVPPSAAARERVTPGSSSVWRGVFWSTSTTWKSGRVAEVALRRPAPRPASRTAGPGARRPPSVASRTWARRPRKLGSPARSAAHHQGVDEEADQRLGLQPAAARHRRAHRQIVLPRCSGAGAPGSAASSPMNSVAPCRPAEVS